MMDSLKKICMENNAIKDRGVIALAHALEENDTLLSLYLENKALAQISDEATKPDLHH